MIADDFITLINSNSDKDVVRRLIKTNAKNIFKSVEGNLYIFNDNSAIRLQHNTDNFEARK